jgi:hypothetical protein
MLRFILNQLSEKIEKYSCPCPAVKAHTDSRGAVTLRRNCTLVLVEAAWLTLRAGRRYLRNSGAGWAPEPFRTL